MRTCRELGIATVAVYSEADRGALHARYADEAYAIGPAAPSESYLDAERLVTVAKRTGCDAVHPGYGFLAENADFAQAVSDAGLIFVGPPASVQRALGEKTSARRLAAAEGVPVAEGTMEPLADEAAVREVAERIGYPVMLKPAGGGGGKGMRIVRAPEELAGAYRGATGEGRTSFGKTELLVEKLIEHARHVEVQLLADDHGRVVWLGERDCSVQRRHQKLIEETPGPAVDQELRSRLGEAAVRIARAAHYRNAGTAEFLVAPDGSFVFLEMNTRLQVEHPVTELVTGLDLVALQFAVAAGDPLPFEQHDVVRRGAAIELRITAEDPHGGFLPAGGTITLLREASGPGVRVDSSLYDGMAVPTEYDPLLAKIAVWGPDRGAALRRARRAVRETLIGGVTTTLPFHAHVLAEEDFAAGRYDTGYVPAHWPPAIDPELDPSATAAAAHALVLGQASAAPRVRAPIDGAWARAAREEALR